MNRFVVLLVAVLVVCLAWSGAWLFASGYVHREVLALANADGLTNPRLTCADLDVGGFPFRLDVVCRGAEVTLADTAIALEEARASVMVYAPTHLLAFARGPAVVSDAFTGTRRQLDWTSLEASARTNWLRPARVSVVGKGLSLSDTLIGTTPLASAEALELHLVDDGSAPASPGTMTLDAFVVAEGVDAGALGIAQGRLRFASKTSALPDDVRLLAAPDLLQAWQQAGGEVTITEFDAADATTTLKASGSLSLNPAGQLNGAINTTSTGIAERTAQVLAEPWRTLALGQPAADGSYSQALTLRDGVAFAGLLPILQIPALF